MGDYYDNFKKLTEADNDVEANLIVNLLKNNGINSLTKAEGRMNIAKAYTGRNFSAVGIYVRAEDYDDAYEIISEIKKTGNTPKIKRFYSGAEKWYARAILAIFLIILIVNLIMREL